MSDDWLAIDESHSENLVRTTQGDESKESSLSSGTASLGVTSSSRSGLRSPGSYRYVFTRIFPYYFRISVTKSLITLKYSRVA